MPGGPTTPELVRAVSRAGALGSFGFAYTQSEAMQHGADAVRAHTHAPFGVNLLANPQPDPVAPNQPRDAVALHYVELGLTVPEPVRPPNTLIFDTVAHQLDYPPRWDVTDNA